MVHSDVCCVWHRSHLISVPCQWDDFWKNCWPKTGTLQRYLLMCILLFLHSKGAALLFSSQHPILPMESLARYWHYWCFHGEQRCRMERRLPGSKSNPGIWHTKRSWKEQWDNSVSWKRQDCSEGFYFHSLSLLQPVWRSVKEGRLEEFAAIIIKYLILHCRQNLKLGAKIFTL